MPRRFGKRLPFSLGEHDTVRRVALTLLGLTAWLTTVAGPGKMNQIQWFASALPFGALALGELLSFARIPTEGSAEDRARARRRREVGVGVLLGIFPASLAVLHAWVTPRESLSAIDALAAGLGIGVYFLGVSEVMTQLPGDASILRRPLGVVAPDRAARTRRNGRRRVLWITGLGALALAALGPAALGSTTTPSPEALTFTAVLGGVTGIAAVGAFAGTAMRRRRKPGPLRLDRVALFVLVTLVAFALLRYVSLIS